MYSRKNKIPQDPTKINFSSFNSRTCVPLALIYHFVQLVFLRLYEVLHYLAGYFGLPFLLLHSYLAFKLMISIKRNTSPAFEWDGRWKLLWCWPEFGLALLLYLHEIRLFEEKKWIYFELLRVKGCVESKNMTSAKRKSTMSSLNPSIIQVGSFKCRADVPLITLFQM